jgi:hypothetical protein
VLLIARITDSFSLGLATGFLVILVPEWVLFAHSFRKNVLDGLLTTLILVAGFWSWKGYNELAHGRSARYYLAVFSAICGVATLVKSVAGLVPIFPVFLLVLMQPNSLKEKARSFISLTTGPLIFFGYCFLLYVMLPKSLPTFIGIEILHRATTGFEGHNLGKPFFYFTYLFDRSAFLPLGLLLVGIFGTVSLLTVKNKGDKDMDKLVSSSTRVGARYLVMMAWCPIFLFSLSSAKLPWYISPYAPFFIGSALLGVVFVFRFLIARPWLSQRKSIQRGFLLFTLFMFCLPLIPRAQRVLNFVMNPMNRLPIDLVVERIRAEKGNVIIVDNVISNRATPIKGRFNVEGIYKEMLHDRIKKVSSTERTEYSPGDFVFVARDAVQALPEGGEEIARLPPLSPRREEVIVLKY